MKASTFNLDDVLFPFKHLICSFFTLNIVGIIKLSDESDKFKVMTMQGLFAKGKTLERLKFLIKSNSYSGRLTNHAKYAAEI